MRIAIWHNLPSGGGKRALYYHVRGLVERGHEVESWCPSTADQSYLPLSDLITEHIKPLPSQVKRGKLPPDRYLTTYHRIVDQIDAMDRHCQECADEINEKGFDLLFANSCMFFRVTSIGRYIRIPKVLYLQEPYRWLYEAMPQLPWIALPPGTRGLRKFLKDLVKVQGLRVQAREELYNARAFDTILVNSAFSRESVLRAYGLDAKVCYLGVDTDKFRPLSIPKQDFIVGLGAFVREKNIDLVIRALSRLEEPRPRLVWIGNVIDRNYTDYLKQTAESLDVAFEPKLRVSDEELIDTLNAALLMVYAPRLEPFGLAPLEANACGLPVIAVAEGGVRETIIDGVNGFVVEHDEEAMADAIERVLSDRQLADCLGKRGREIVLAKWSLYTAVNHLEHAFQRVLTARTDDLRFAL